MKARNNQPRVSIIVLTWNNYEDTQQCIKSILELTYSNTELILVDNSSTDGSIQRLIKEFNQFRVIYSSTNLGFSRGFNLGICASIQNESKYVLLVTDDVILPKDYLQLLVNFMEGNPDAGIIGSKAYYLSNPKMFWAAGGKINWLKGTVIGYGHKEIDEGQYDYIREVDYIPAAVMMIRIKVFKKIGLLPECYFGAGEEADFAVKAKRAGFKVYHVPHTSYLHKVGDSAKQTNRFIYNRFRNRLLFLQRNHSKVVWYFCFIYFWFYHRIIFGVASIAIKNRKLKEKRFLAKLAIRDHRIYSVITLKHLINAEETLNNALK